MTLTDQIHYHCQYKKFTRAKGQSAVQAAAYRLAKKLEDERTGLTHNYTRKGGVTDTLCATPTGIKAPAWVHDPAKLWNAVEAAEKTNPRALVMHEWEIALPAPLTPDQRKAAAREMAQFIADRYGCVAMAAFHNPNREGDQRNYHIHLMFTPRMIEQTGFSKKKFRNYSLRAPEAEAKGLLTGAAEIVFIREQWALIGNRHLMSAGHAPTLDHRSYEDQGIDLEPEKHLGPDATAKERRGERTAKGDFNRAVQFRNRNRQEWAQAWEQAKIDITGNRLPEPPAPKPLAKAADQKKPEPPAPLLPKAFLNLMENQKQERTSVIHLHITERKNLWREQHEKKRAHKIQWAKLYRQQSKEREALNARYGTWTSRILRRLDFTGQLSKAHQVAITALERQQKIERAELGRIHRTNLQTPEKRLQAKHEKELVAVDSRHIEQRHEILSREARNRALTERLKSTSRSRDHGRGPSHGR